MVASPPRKSNSESFIRQTRGPALGTAPARGPWGFCHRGTSRRQLPTSAHAHFRAGNGEERGRTQRVRNPATFQLNSPQPHHVCPASVRGPMVCNSRRLLPTVAWGPYRTTVCADPGSPHIVCSDSMRACENGGPFGRGGDVLGGEERCLPSRFQERWVACPGPRPGLRLRTCTLAGGHTPARLRMVGEEECARTGDSNPGCNYLVRGYSPSMHFFWGGDMPRYSPPSIFGGSERGARVCWQARAALADILAGCRARAHGLERALAPTWLQQPRASRQSVLPF